MSWEPTAKLSCGGKKKALICSHDDDPVVDGTPPEHSGVAYRWWLGSLLVPLGLQVSVAQIFAFRHV